MQRRGKPSFGFTLVELLVVIALIAILIAILLPVLSRVRRTATVLASPIAYTANNGSVHLTSGASDVTIPGRADVFGCSICHCAPSWSPSGTMLAFPDADRERVTIVEPMPNKIRYLNWDRLHFLSWADSGHFIKTDRARICIVDIDQGAVQETVTRIYWGSPMMIAPTPLTAPFPYIGIAFDSDGASIAFFKKDLSLARRIYSVDLEPSVPIGHPRVDFTGEYVAWTHNRRAMIKHIREPVSTPPSLIGDDRPSWFCDFTEQGDLLLNIAGARNYFAIYDKNGRLLRELHPPIPPGPGDVATWRKYEHR